LTFAFAVACLAGALAYVVVFVALSLRFSRALVFGLVYVFVWEGAISQLISGARFLSIHAYTVGIARALTDVSTVVLDASLSAPLATFLLTVLVVGGSAYSVRLLMRYQIAERT
jgi:ABC-2 type transport system permease protein